MYVSLHSQGQIKKKNYKNCVDYFAYMRVYFDMNTLLLV